MILFTGFLSFIFSVIGFIIIYSHFYFKVKGRRISGEVIGIEKFISTTRSSNTISKSLMYRPVVQYLFNGTPYIFVGGGRNIISYVVGETINLLNIKSSAKLTKIDSNFSLLFGLGFCLSSLLPGHHFITSTDELNTKLLCIISYCTLLIFGYKKIQSYNKEVNIILQLLSISKFETHKSLEGRDIFTTKEEIKSEEGKHFKLALIITTLFLISMLCLLFSCYNNMSSDSLEFVSTFLSKSHTQIEVKELFRNDPKLIGASFSLIMALLCSYSIVFQLKKR